MSLVIEPALAFLGELKADTARPDTPQRGTAALPTNTETDSAGIV
jgi:hypothetical protein